jgi:NAD(P)-dependent dehydrogenase (short-subunit alcohol dehydrogenase family)
MWLCVTSLRRALRSVYAAGYIRARPRVLDLTLEEWSHILSVNLTGVFHPSREAVRVMTPKKSGAIVNIGSYACFLGFPQIGAYAVSKGGLAQPTSRSPVGRSAQPDEIAKVAAFLASLKRPKPVYP